MAPGVINKLAFALYVSSVNSGSNDRLRQAALRLLACIAYENVFLIIPARLLPPSTLYFAMLFPLALLFCSLLPQAKGLPQQELIELVPGAVRERKQIAPGETHQYLIAAQGGDRIEGMAAQYGVDIELRLWAPNRLKSKKFDYGRGTVEPFRHRAAVNGDYTLEVHSLATEPGEYGLYLGLCDKEALQWPDLAAQFLMQVPPHHPGMAACIIEGGRLEFLQARGLADVESHQALELDSPFRLGRLSFAFYAHAFLELEARGEVDLQATIKSLLPWFPDYPEAFTLADLIRIQTGLPNCLPLLQWTSGDKTGHFSREEIVAMLSFKQDIKPYPSWRPNGDFTDEFLIQEALVAVSGKTLAEAMDSLVFQPLGMEHSRVAARDDYPQPADNLINLDDGDWEVRKHDFPHLPFLSTTSRDLATWFIYLLSQEPGPASTWTRLREWDMIRDYDPDRGLFYKVLPEHDVVVFEKTISWEGVSLRGGSRIDEVLFEEWPLDHPREQMYGSRGRNHIEVDPKLDDLLPFCGVYRCEQADLQVTIAIEDGELIITDGDEIQSYLEVSKNLNALFEKGFGIFSSLSFEALDGDKHSSFRLYLRGGGRVIFRRIN